MDKEALKNEIDSLIQKLKDESVNLLDFDKISDEEINAFQSNSELLSQKIIELKSLFEKYNKNKGPAEIKNVPLDLFGETISAKNEKPKQEKKEVKGEEKGGVKNIQKLKLDNIHSAIGLNDKFQFANELFEGSISEYTVAIQQLNTAGTIESAMEYFESLQNLYNWDIANETVKRLLDLIDRRYS